MDRRRTSSCRAPRRSPTRPESLPPTSRRRRPPRPAVRTLPSIDQAEYQLRRESVAAGMDAAGLDALCVFYPARITYLTGFHHIPTERPIALVLGRDHASLVVPAVEKEHAESIPGLDPVDVYFEYPGERPPLELVAEVVRKLEPRRVAADHDGVVP